MNQSYFIETEAGDLRQEDNFKEVKRIFFLILRKWYYLVLCVVLAIAAAYLINKTTSRVYLVSASVLVKEPKDLKNSVSGQLLEVDQELLKSGSNLENEGILLKKFSNVKKTLDDLDFSVFYYREGKFGTAELYGNSPLRVKIDSGSVYIPGGISFVATIVSKTKFLLQTDHQDWEPFVPAGKLYTFGQTVNLNGIKFIVYLTDFFDPATDEEIAFVLNDMYQLADYYIGSVNIEPLQEKSSILKLSLETTQPARDIDFLNKLVTNYLQTQLVEKSTNATNTLQFIDLQLKDITDSLRSIETRLENFKTENTIDLSSEGVQLYTNIQELEKQRGTLLVKIKYLTYLKKYIQTEDNLGQAAIPSSMGIDDPVLNKMISDLLTLQQKMKSLKSTGKEENPILRMERQKVQELKSSILKNISNLEKGNQISLNNVNNRIQQLTQNLKSLPGAERELINIERVHNLSETLYLFLMQKRAEAGIAKAATSSDLTLVNEARLENGGIPIKPKPLMNYISAVFMGLLLPVVLIYFTNQFNSKITSEDELLKLSSIPLLGIIGHNHSRQELINQSPRTAIAESFRTIRSNIRLASLNASGCRTYLVTSCISGEGKTFCARNLAYIFAVFGKKTLFINTDMRKPNTYLEFGVSQTLGLSDFLSGNAVINQVIYPTNTSNLFILPSGGLPANPSDLLLSEEFGKMMALLKQEFHYIIMDSPPVGFLADALELAPFTDLLIAVVRQNYTQKECMALLNQINKQRKAQQTAIILNDVDLSKFNYGVNSRYGYQYYAHDAQPQKWWKRLLVKN